MGNSERLLALFRDVFISRCEDTQNISQHQIFYFSLIPQPRCFLRSSESLTSPFLRPVVPSPLRPKQVTTKFPDTFQHFFNHGSLTFNIQYSLLLMRHKRTFFDLKDCGTLNTLESMPYILGDINTVASIFMTEDDAITNGTIIIKGWDLYLTSQYDKGLVFRWMMMHRHYRTRFQRIQATDGAASTEPCLHELCRVVTEVEHRSTDGTCHPTTDGSYNSSSVLEIPLPVQKPYQVKSGRLPS